MDINKIASVYVMKFSENGRYIDIAAKVRGAIFFHSGANALFAKYPDLQTIYLHAFDRDQDDKSDPDKGLMVAEYTRNGRAF